MAKFVIAGQSNCPYFARVELLADQLALNLPDFRVHKIVKDPSEWETWLRDTCHENGWVKGHCPIVWRELIDRGGKGVLVGGSNDFQEYAHEYYGVRSPMTTDDMRNVSSENRDTKVKDVAIEEADAASIDPLNVCVTCACAPAVYLMIPRLLDGSVFGDETEVSLRLLDSEGNADSLNGLVMECQDTAHPLLRYATAHTDPAEAFRDAGVVIFMDDPSPFDTAPGPETGSDESELLRRHRLLKANEDLFSAYGEIVEREVLHDCKIMVANETLATFNTQILLGKVTRVPRQNIVGATRSLENTAKSILARRLKVRMSDIADVIVWGSSSDESKFVDVSRSRVNRYNGSIYGPPDFSRPVPELVHDDKWLETEFLEALVSHPKTLLEKGLPSLASSSAAAVTSLLRDWWKGSNTGEIHSLAVNNEGWYDLPEGLVISLPVHMHQGSWEAVQNLNIPDDTREKLNALVSSLQGDLELAEKPPTPPPTVAVTGDPAEDGAPPEKVFGGDEEGPGPGEREGGPTAPGDQDGAQKVLDEGLSEVPEEGETEQETPGQEGEGPVDEPTEGNDDPDTGNQPTADDD